LPDLFFRNVYGLQENDDAIPAATDFPSSNCYGHRVSFEYSVRILVSQALIHSRTLLLSKERSYLLGSGGHFTPQSTVSAVCIDEMLAARKLVRGINRSYYAVSLTLKRKKLVHAFGSSIQG